MFHVTIGRGGRGVVKALCTETNAMVAPLLMQLCQGGLQEDMAVATASTGGVDTNEGGGGGFVFLGV